MGGWRIEIENGRTRSVVVNLPWFGLPGSFATQC